MMVIRMHQDTSTGIALWASHHCNMASPFARYAFKTLKLEKPLNTPIKKVVIHQKDLCQLLY
jgi:hypothetical protein